MGVIAHNHDWSAISGGYRCLNCTAAFMDADVAANPPNASEKNAKDGLNTRDFFSRIWRSVKGGA